MLLDAIIPGILNGLAISIGIGLLSEGDLIGIGFLGLAGIFTLLHTRFLKNQKRTGFY